jgi:hypothetical protein
VRELDFGTLCIGNCRALLTSVLHVLTVQNRSGSTYFYSAGGRVDVAVHVSSSSKKNVWQADRLLQITFGPAGRCRAGSALAWLQNTRFLRHMSEATRLHRLGVTASRHSLAMRALILQQRRLHRSSPSEGRRHEDPPAPLSPEMHKGAQSGILTLPGRYSASPTWARGRGNLCPAG